MKTTARISWLCLLLAAMLLWVAVPAQAAKAKSKATSGDDWETLEQYVADLQKNPGNEAQRIKIINLVLEMKRPPAIPEEARRHYVTGKTLSDDAKKPEDFGEAIEEFKKALLIAPWWPEANGGLALALKAADRYDEAISFLKLYILTNPAGDKPRKAQDELYILEAKKKSGERDFSNLLQKLDNGRWDCLPPERQYPDFIKIEARRFSLFSSWWDADNPALCFTAILESRSFEVPGYSKHIRKVSVTISEDGKEITVTRFYTDLVAGKDRISEKFIRVR